MMENLPLRLSSCPRYGVRKKYVTTVEGEVTPDMLRQPY